MRHRVAGAAGPEGLAPSTSRFGTALADIARCAACGHMQLEPMPAAAELTGAYEEAESDDYLLEERGQRATARATLERIARHTGGRELLDLGCWVGFLLDEARRAGWGVTGVEPSRFASTHAREVLGLEVRGEDLLTVELEPARYDAVVMADVIEHLVDPGRALARIERSLRDGGVLYLALPDAGSLVARVLGRRWWSVIPTHVQYFTRRSLRTLMHRCGWEVLELTTAPKAFSLAYYLSRLNGYSPRVGSGLVRLAARLGAADRLVRPDFRDRMAVVARPRPKPAAAEGGIAGEVL